MFGFKRVFGQRKGGKGRLADTAEAGDKFAEDKARLWASHMKKRFGSGALRARVDQGDFAFGVSFGVHSHARASVALHMQWRYCSSPRYKGWRLYGSGSPWIYFPA